MASPNISQILTTTLENRTKKLADNVTKSRALLSRLQEKGNVRKVSGGATIRQELEYAENGTVLRYSGYDLLNISPSDVLTSAEFDYKQVAVAVAMSGLEMLQNQGENAIIDLMGAKIKNAEKSIMNTVASDCFSDGTATGSRQIGGLQLLVSSTPTTGTVGGISAVTWSFWRNEVYKALTDGGAVMSAANIQKYMNTIAIKLNRDSDRPDLIIAEDASYNLYLQSLQAIQRITSEKMATAGFTALQFAGGGNVCDVVLERTAGLYTNSGMTASAMYFLNTDYLFLRPHNDRHFKVDDAERVNPNQDAIVKLIFWAGNMTVSNRALQGLLLNT